MRKKVTSPSRRGLLKGALAAMAAPMFVPGRVLGKDGAVSSAAEEPEIIVPNLPPMPALVSESSLFADEPKKDSKKYKKDKKK